MKTKATKPSNTFHQAASNASVPLTRRGAAGTMTEVGPACATLQRYKWQANSSPQSTSLVQRSATMATSAAAALLRGTQLHMDASSVPTAATSAAKSILQRRVINMAGDNDEVVRSAEILASDHAQEIVAWPFEGELKAGETEIFVDHSTGDKLGGKPAEDFADELVPRTQPQISYSMYIAACHAAKGEVSGGLRGTGGSRSTLSRRR